MYEQLTDYFIIVVITTKLAKKRKNYTETATTGRNRWRGTVRPNGRLLIRRLPLHSPSPACRPPGRPVYPVLGKIYWHTTTNVTLLVRC